MSLTIAIDPRAINGDDAATVNTMHGQDVPTAAYRIAHDYPGGLVRLAQILDMSPNVLQNKINPNNTTHHLTLAEAVRMQQATGDAAILHAMADTLGYACTRVAHDIDQGDPIDTMVRLQTSMADLMHAVADAVRAGEGAVSSNQMRRADFQAQELIASIGSLLAMLRSRMRERPISPGEESASVGRPRAALGLLRMGNTQNRTSGSFREGSQEGNSHPDRFVDSGR